MQKMNTLHSVWFTQDAIMALDDQKEAQKLADCVGDGCVGVFCQDKLIDIQPDVKGKRWSLVRREKGKRDVSDRAACV